MRYSDGVVNFAASDVMSHGFGVDLGLTRNWTNETDYNPSGAFGNNWIFSELPTLVNDGANAYAVISSGTDARVYTKDGGGNFTTTASLYVQDRLEHSPTGGGDVHEYYLADSSGATFTFYDFTVSPTEVRGKPKRFSDDQGNVTTYTYAGPSNALSEIRRGPTTATESFLFTYDANNRVSHVTWRKTSDSTANPIVWTTIREVGYGYYGASDSNGNSGDLKLAAVHDPSADKTISTSLTWASNEVSATFSSSPGYVVGDVITVSGVSPSGYNGTFVVSDVSGNTIKYALTSNPGTVTVLGKTNRAMDMNYYRYFVNSTEEIDGDTLEGDGYQGGLQLSFDERAYRGSMPRSLRHHSSRQAMTTSKGMQLRCLHTSRARSRSRPSGFKARVRTPVEAMAAASSRTHTPRTARAPARAITITGRRRRSKRSRMAMRTSFTPISTGK